MKKCVLFKKNHNALFQHIEVAVVNRKGYIGSITNQNHRL